MKTAILSLLLISGFAHASQDIPAPKPLECTLDKSVFSNKVIGEVEITDNDGHGHLEKRFEMKEYPGYTMIATSFTADFKGGYADGVQIRIKNPQQANTELGESMITITGLSMAELWFTIEGKLAAARCYVK
ncbi:MAG TPA: hypothetical protein VIG33_03030 [Pseudobdellovibrionaceae bacterium]|jgi:hypothetical protein